MKHIERLRKLVTLAAKMDWIPIDPFAQLPLRAPAGEGELVEAWTFQIKVVNIVQLE